MNICLLNFILCSRGILKATILLLPLLGMTWIIGILAVSEETQVFAWIFAILNTLQVNNNYYYIYKLLSYMYVIDI